MIRFAKDEFLGNGWLPEGKDEFPSGMDDSLREWDGCHTSTFEISCSTFDIRFS